MLKISNVVSGVPIYPSYILYDDVIILDKINARFNINPHEVQFNMPYHEKAR